MKSNAAAAAAVVAVVAAAAAAAAAVVVAVVVVAAAVGVCRDQATVSGGGTLAWKPDRKAEEGGTGILDTSWRRTGGAAGRK